MKIQDIDLIYIQGRSPSSQGIKGKINYPHKERTKNGSAIYNGLGYKREYIPATLRISAIDENENEIFYDIKKHILESFDRKNLSEPFVNKLEDALNGVPEVVCEKDIYGNLIFSKNTLIQVKKIIK